MQLHRKDDTIFFFSRNAHDHAEKSNYSVMEAAVNQQIPLAKGDFILDGELVVYNKTT